jgi:hypothetical protein
MRAEVSTEPGQDHLPAQQAEAIIGVTALNRMLDAGSPTSVRTA